MCERDSWGGGSAVLVTDPSWEHEGYSERLAKSSLPLCLPSAGIPKRSPTQVFVRDGPI